MMCRNEVKNRGEESRCKLRVTYMSLIDICSSMLTAGELDVQRRATSG